MTRVGVIGSLVLAAAALAAGLALLYARHPLPADVAPPPDTFERWIDLGVPAPGVRVARVERPSMPRTHHLVVEHGERTFDLDRAEQMAGLVRIEAPEQALTWVRFAGSLAGKREIRLKLDEPRWHEEGDPDALRRGRRRAYGTWGDLTARDMKAGGFAPAKVVRTAGGFVVDRWVYVPSVGRDYCRVEHLREVVGRDGALSTTLLVHRKAPWLPEGEWGVLFPLM